jgi:hypothetical protein
MMEFQELSRMNWMEVPMSDIHEVIIFEEGKVKITNLRAVIGTKTYTLSDITSVTRKKRKTGDTDFFWWWVSGALFIIISAVDLAYLWCFDIIGLMFFLGALGKARAAKTVYVVKIGSSSGERNVLEAYDRQYIKRIVNAMNEAIVCRG